MAEFSERRWLVKNDAKVAHTFTAATMGKVTSLCGLATITVSEIPLWTEVRDQTPRCRDCETLLALAALSPLRTPDAQ